MDNNETLVRKALQLVLDGAQLATSSNASAPLQCKESLRDIVTATDLAIDDLIARGLATTGIPVISEENEKSLVNIGSERFWVVDPIDGTVNFAHQLPNFAVSIGLVERDAFSLGFVCAPQFNELYFTLTSEQALLNGQTIQHPHTGMDQALLAASFGARACDAEYLLFKRLGETSRGCLRTGSASLNICWAAVGKLQAAYGFRAKLWDVAGALAIARAAGCSCAIVYTPGALTIDYCVGSQQVVANILSEARQFGLWSKP